MRPEDARIQFDPDTITLAITAWLMGASGFEGDDADALGQLYAILIGDCLRMSLDGETPPARELVADFVKHLKGCVPDSLLMRFGSTDPSSFESTYAAIVAQSDELGVDKVQLTNALRHISVVRQLVK
jgi:hypothetical protein